ncbi:hypothetical protein A2870_01775 [Candidatus Curtissbacteria bacterium RIFCSPHIGHO2_01_FULL_41_11]|uniref:Uncharacterized protein n=1 Tax=Candidatus Curtissbacteria bacterium RIFCSPHIGHO2_01_FULL_41_11 TaxID=1797711 RepID=A0A1F5G584_9BACT|nr:MAG: hypothetical protein A2870_01775 [Candidatus Curtissbacteria bacterium RIFCSPHIGHO2_01_FULL_41_11]
MRNISIFRKPCQGFANYLILYQQVVLRQAQGAPLIFFFEILKKIKKPRKLALKADCFLELF